MPHTILIVEDDDELLKLYRLGLERGGYRVLEASNGAEALEAVEVERPDLIILDILMPTMGGESVLRRLDANPDWHDIKVVVVSAYPSFHAKALELNADGFLVKPIKMGDMLDAIRAQLGN